MKNARGDTGIFLEGENRKDFMVQLGMVGMVLGTITLCVLGDSAGSYCYNWHLVVVRKPVQWKPLGVL